MKEIREVLRKLIKYQKIPCVCEAGKGLEMRSIDQAEAEIKKIFLGWVGGDRKLGHGPDCTACMGYNCAKAEMRRKVEL